VIIKKRNVYINRCRNFRRQKCEEEEEEAEKILKYKELAT